MNRWMLPVLGALAFHFALFTIDLGFAPPMLMIPESKAVTISLVEVPPAPPPEKTPAPHPVRSAPMKKTIKSQRPKSISIPAPLPSDPLSPAPAQIEPAATDTAPPAKIPEADETAIATPPPDVPEEIPRDHVQVQASLPLYHLNPPPIYPAVARRRNYQGTTVLDVLVDGEGNAAQVKVRKSSGYAMLDRSAMNAVKQWRFESARRMGRAVEMWVQVPVRFELE